MGTFKSNSLSLSFCHSHLIIFFCLFPHITINSVTQATNLGVFHYFNLLLLIQFVSKPYRFYFLSISVHQSPHPSIKPVTRALFKVHLLILNCDFHSLEYFLQVHHPQYDLSKLQMHLLPRKCVIFIPRK